MLGPFDYFVWFLGIGVELYLIYVASHRGHLRRYPAINAYALSLFVVTVSNLLLVHKFGYRSAVYFFFYYYSDLILTVVLFLAVTELYVQVFQEMQTSRQIRGAATLLLAATAGFSYLIVSDNKDHLMNRFVIELSQNLYFVGVVLTYLLWGAVVKLRETRARLVHLVLSLGIFFSVHTVIYALRNLFPEFVLLRSLLPLVGTFLPLAWAYTFTFIPEEARLAPARVAAVQR